MLLVNGQRLLNFTYSNGDAYTGYTYAEGGSYTVGQTRDVTVEGGLTGTYRINAAALVSKVTGDGMAGAVAGSVNVKKASFTGRLDIRLIEVETGEILGAWKDEDKVDNTSVKVAGTGGDVQYDEELVNKVFEPIVARIAPKLLRATVAAGEDE